jgi:hypothetical protein
MKRNLLSIPCGKSIQLSLQTGISIFAFQRLRVYTNSSPTEPFHFLFRPRIVPAAPNCRSGLLKTRYHGFW